MEKYILLGILAALSIIITGCDTPDSGGASVCGDGTCDVDESYQLCSKDCNPPAGSCTDSDGGNTIYVKGDCVDVRGTTYSDSCTTSSGGTVGIEEAYCGFDNYCVFSNVACTCYNGACLQNTYAQRTVEEGASANNIVLGNLPIYNVRVLTIPDFADPIVKFNITGKSVTGSFLTGSKIWELKQGQSVKIDSGTNIYTVLSIENITLVDANDITAQDTVRFNLTLLTS